MSLQLIHDDSKFHFLRKNAGNNAFKDNDAEVALAELLMLTNVTRANVNAFSFT